MVCLIVRIGSFFMFIYSILILSIEYKEFREYAFTIQNGTHPSPPINPVVSALNDLQSELEDIVVGFETRLRRIKREGERAFVHDETVEKLEMQLEENHDTTQPEVSILPIADPDFERPVDVEAEIPHILMGRDREEILGALERATQLQSDAVDQNEVDQQIFADEKIEENLNDADAGPDVQQAILHMEL